MAFWRKKNRGYGKWRPFRRYRMARAYGGSRRSAAKAQFGGLLKAKNMAMLAALLIGLMVWLNWAGIKQAWTSRGLLGSGEPQA